jgi:hypothetical protein
MRSYRTTYSGDIRPMFRNALVTCIPQQAGAIKGALRQTRTAARAGTPVYVPAKWLSWQKYPNHHIPPGTLRNSIHFTEPRSYSGRLFVASFGSKAPFASHIEEGFWHKKARKWVVGHHMIESSCDLVLGPTVITKLDAAVRRMFKA